MKRLTSAMLAMVMAAMSIMTAFAEGAVTIPEIESGYTITYPEPVDESLINDVQLPEYEELQENLSYEENDIQDVVHKQNNANEQMYNISSTYEQDIIDLQIQTKYYENTGQNLYIDNATGNVQYKRTDISIPVKNGLSMDLTIKYDLQDAYFEHYFAGSPTVNLKEGPIAVGWSFNITKRENNTIILADGRSFQFDSRGIVDNWCYDVEYLKDKDTGEYYLLYRDGTKEYFALGYASSYISRKEDKYGNKIFYEYESAYSEKLTRISNNVSNIEINISYDSDRVVATCSDGNSIAYYREPRTYTYNYYSTNNVRTANVYVLTEICSLLPNATTEIEEHGVTHAAFDYELFDSLTYSVEEEDQASASAVMTSVVEKPGGEYAELTYTARPISYSTRVTAVKTYKPNNSINAAIEKTYSYSHTIRLDGESYKNGTIITDADGNKRYLFTNDSVRYEKLINSSNKIKSSTYTRHCYHHMEMPEYTIEKVYNNNGNYITTRYDYTHSNGLLTKCVKSLVENDEPEEIYTTEYTYYTDEDHYPYYPLWKIKIEKDEVIFKNIEYKVNDLNDVTEEYISCSADIRKIQYTYDTDNNLIKTEIKDANNNVLSQETMEYSDTYNNAVLTKVTNGVGNSVAYEYAADTLRLNKIIDGRNNCRQIEYDSYGRITKEINADGTSTTIKYWNEDNSIDVRNENGYMQTYWYRHGQVRELTEGTNYETTLTTVGFDDFGRPISSTDALGNTTTVEYDTLGRQSKVTYPAIGTNAAGSIQVKYYDVFLEGSTKYSMRMTISQENAVSLEYFDVRGRLVKTAMVNNPSTLLSKADIDTMTSLPTDTQLIVTGTYTYDEWDRLITQTDGMGRTISYTYDIFGNVLSTTYGDGTKIFPVYYEYDAAGNLTKMTQGTHVTTYEYNLAGQLTKMTDPMGYTETYTYDAAGNVATYKDKNGVTTTYTYDNRNRLIKQTKGAKSIEYTYDSVGNVLTQKNENGTIKLEYNTDGTLQKKTMPDGKSISYTYDDAKKVATMTDYFGAKTTYTYTGGNYISKIDTAHGDIEYYYRKDGKISEECGDGHETLYGYDNIGRVSFIWPGNEGIIGYVYDNSGNIVTKRDIGSSLNTTYIYDDVNRLIQEKPGNQTYYYTYDKYNNLTYSILGNTDKMYSYDANNRITTSTVYGDPTKDIIYDYFSEYEYDKNGNLITEERRYDAMKKGTYELIASDTEYDDRGYDVWGNLTYTHDEDVANGVITYLNMTYYADGMRKSKGSTISNAGTVSSNTYNYYYHGDTVINETRTASGTTSNYATNIIGVTGIEARKQNGTTGFFAKDLHGDVRYVFNSSGTKIADYTYDAWGNNATSSTSTWAQANPVRYNGQYLDTETGMYYLRARYYDPNMNRFISEDPIKDGLNWYAYCRNNPIRYIDPTGYITEEEQKMYESGKMAPMAYSHLMNLTYQWYLADDEASKAKYHQWAEDFRANDYKTTNGAFPNVDAGIEYMPSMFFGEPNKEQHYFRNQLNLNFSWSQYTTLQERLPENMKWDDKVAADYHQNNIVNNKPNRKYVSFDGHFELVYNDDNILLTEYNNPHDMGTYNYVHPTKDPIGHGIKDVKPYGAIWIKWGNVPEHAGTLYK